MNLYAETSAVLRWLFEEAGFEETLELLASADKILCSRLTLIETHRVLRRAVLQGALTEAPAARVRATFAQAAARWAVAEVSAAIGTRAEQAFPVEPVRTLDALHLATALRLREAVPDLAVLSTDERVRANAAALGFEIFPEALPGR